MINEFILAEGKIIIIRGSVKEYIFVYVSYSTHRTELEEESLDMYLNVVIDCKENILGIDGMQPRYESAQNSSYSPSQERENPIRKRQAYIRGYVRLPIRQQKRRKVHCACQQLIIVALGIC